MTTTPARHDASSITDDQLDTLYAERDRLAARVETLEHVARVNGKAHRIAYVASVEHLARAEQAEALARDTAHYIAATHRAASHHDVLGENLTCAGCALAARIDAALNDPC